MTGTHQSGADGRLPPRRARIESRVPDADVVAAAVAPDDTDDVATRAADGAVVTEIERPTTASLEATVDDAVVALGVATEVAAVAGRHAPTPGDAADAIPDDAADGADAASASRDADDARSSTPAGAQPDDQPTRDGADGAPPDADTT